MSTSQRKTLARYATFAVPLLAGVASASAVIGLELYQRRGGLPAGTFGLVTGAMVVSLFGGAALAAFGAAIGAVLLPEHRTGTRLTGAILYGIAGLLAYFVILIWAAQMFL